MGPPQVEIWGTHPAKKKRKSSTSVPRHEVMANPMDNTKRGTLRAAHGWAEEERYEGKTLDTWRIIPNCFLWYGVWYDFVRDFLYFFGGEDP